ncbi:MAG: HK97 family phage prohead protease [Gloeomargaritaceae cyanobacterium C42_A2020_066]|nr:HK97 family phage prohead protease [Gloeomargaritaceae cyanobacterium C42_A2020_066]
MADPPLEKRSPRSRERPAGHLRFVQGKERTLEFSASSDLPISTVYADREVLIHTPAAMNIRQTLEGCTPPLLFNHNRDDYIGVVESARYEANRLIVVVRFDTHPRAEQVYQSILNGTLSGVSIGYEPLEWTTAADGTLVITKWRWLEISITPMPADKTVGIGRNEPPIKEYSIMTEQRGNYAHHPESIEGERDRVNALHMLGQRDSVPRERVQKWIENGATLEDALRETFTERQRREPAPRPISIAVAFRFETLSLTSPCPPDTVHIRLLG